jgi:hypothetical protein
MKKLTIAIPFAVAALGLVPVHAEDAAGQKEALGLFYIVKVASLNCGWTDAGDPAKLDASIAELEKQTAITPAEKAEAMEKMAAELKSDPSSCADNGMPRAMYNEAIK